MKYNRTHRRTSELAVAPKARGNIAGRFALVISASRVNTIVVSRIIADCGLKAVETDLAGAAGILENSRPLLIVVDGRGEVRSLLDTLTETARVDTPPPVIFMADNGSGDVPDYPFHGIARMPFTSDSFAPMVQNCID